MPFHFTFSSEMMSPSQKKKKKERKRNEERLFNGFDLKWNKCKV